MPDTESNPKLQSLKYIGNDRSSSKKRNESKKSSIMSSKISPLFHYLRLNQKKQKTKKDEVETVLYNTDDKLKSQSASMFQKGKACLAAAQYEKSLICFQKALAARKYKYGPRHEKVRDVHRQVGDVMILLGNYTEASKHYNAAGIQRIIEANEKKIFETKNGIIFGETKEGQQNTRKFFSIRSITSLLSLKKIAISQNDGLTTSYLDLFHSRYEV